jgi:uncharacterized protein YdeI (YjbR/CyaY-like superfamily)
MEMTKSVEEYLESHNDYRPLLEKLRSILNTTEFQETMKWGIPTYTINNKNVVGIGAFKSYAGLWFFNGVFLKDEAKVLINALEGTTKGMRQWRFNSIEDVNEDLIKQYLQEAIQNQKEGKEIKPEKKPLIIPDELKEVLASDVQLFEAFDQLTLTNKRDFVEHIETAKRAETKQSRLQKIIPMIRDGIGLFDKYKNG